jgi:hypothetical protein
MFLYDESTMNGKISTHFRRILFPSLVGLGASILLISIYVFIISLAESFDHALNFFWQDRLYTIPIVMGFGLQAALFSILRKQAADLRQGGKQNKDVTGASGAVSTVAMVACCAHHLTDIAPFLGLTLATTFLVKYQVPFMILALVMNGAGIAIMLRKILKLRKLSIRTSQVPLGEMETIR